ncbi:hypothetical protein [Aromatoleum diolicum]|nr:hypothetical protein [Aromatoleum diolicum]
MEYFNFEELDKLAIGPVQTTIRRICRELMGARNSDSNGDPLCP